MKSKEKRIVPLAVGIAVLLIFSIVFNILSLTKFDNIFEKFFGATPFRLKGNTFGADVDYYKSDFNSASELYAYEEKKVAPAMHAGLESDETGIPVIYDLAARLISCNTQGLAVSADDLRDKYKLNLEALVVFYNVYLDFINEAASAKN